MSKRGRCEEEPPKVVYEMKPKVQVFRYRFWKLIGGKIIDGKVVGRYKYLMTYITGANIYIVETENGLKSSIGVMNVI